jgi:hypothetical protein
MGVDPTAQGYFSLTVAVCPQKSPAAAIQQTTELSFLQTSCEIPFSQKTFQGSSMRSLQSRHADKSWFSCGEVLLWKGAGMQPAQK